VFKCQTFFLLFCLVGSILLVCLSIRSLLIVFLSIGSLLQLCLSICNQILHFQWTPLRSARGTGLLPIYGRNLYKLLCVFLLSLSDFIRCILFLNITSEAIIMYFWYVCFNLEKTKKKKTQFNPPILCFSHLQCLFVPS